MTTNLKTTLIEAIRLGHYVAKILADGKVSFGEGFGFLTRIISAAPLFTSSLPLAIQEFLALSPDASQSLLQEIAHELNLAGDTQGVAKLLAAISLMLSAIPDLTKK